MPLSKRRWSFGQDSTSRVGEGQNLAVSKWQQWEVDELAGACLDVGILRAPAGKSRGPRDKSIKPELLSPTAPTNQVPKEAGYIANSSLQN